MFAPNLCAVVHGPHDLRLEERPIPEIKDNEVLLQMESVGICGSDVKLADTGRCGIYTVEKPIVTGHEGAGTVVMVGAAVRSLSLGERVAVEPNVPCARCELCRAGRYNLCPALRTCAMPPHDGNLATYYAHDADFCYKLPDTIGTDEGAVLQPLTIAVHACRRAGVSLGARVLVIGAGSIGLLTMMTARAMGAKTIVITDSISVVETQRRRKTYKQRINPLNLPENQFKNKYRFTKEYLIQFIVDLIKNDIKKDSRDIMESRVAKARELGADHAALVGADEREQAVLARCEQLMGGRPDIAFECVGSDTTFRQAFLAPRDGGVALIVGISNTTPELPLCQAMVREVDIRGTVRFANNYPTALSMVEKGTVNVKSLISHHYGMDQLAEAFDVARHRKGLKVIIHPYNGNNKNNERNTVNG